MITVPLCIEHTSSRPHETCLHLDGNDALAIGILCSGCGGHGGIEKGHQQTAVRESQSIQVTILECQLDATLGGVERHHLDAQLRNKRGELIVRRGLHGR